MKTLAFVAMALFLQAGDLAACRYTVRDTGFVDLGPPAYLLYLYADTDSREALESAARMHLALRDSNIVVEVAHAVDGKVALTAMMEDGNGRQLLFPAFEADQARKIIQGAVYSPMRKEISRRLLDAFCVILLVGGDVASRDTIRKSIERITPMMSTMDKPYENPPVLVEIPEERLHEERVLVWSLGMDPGKPAAVVLYGKGRRMGPVLSGETLAEGSIMNLMRLIGMDCECGVDLSTLKGPPIPLKWDEEIQDLAAAALGFDPENPMVKLEVSQILSLEKDGQAPETLFGKDPLFGYSEQRIELDEPEEEEEKSIPMIPVLILFLLVVGLLVVFRRFQGSR